MIPLFFEESDENLITQIESDLSGTIKVNGRDLPIRNPITFASSPAIVLNDPTDARDNTYEVDSVSVNPAWDFITEPNAERDGSIGGNPKEVQKVIRISGFARGTNLAQLNDNIAALNRAFNPVLNYQQDLAVSEFNIGFLPLKFYTPTVDTDAWPNGYIAQQYFVRPISMPVDASTKFDDFSARFVIELLAVDPRKYEQTTQLREDTGGGNLVVDNTKATYDSWPIVKITFIDAPSQAPNYKHITGIEAVRSVALDSAKLTDAAGETLVIDHQKRIAYYESDGTDKIGAVKSASKFWKILPGTNTIQFFQFDANAEIDIIWRRAFV